MNGAVEAANKNIKKILVKMTDTYKDWHKFLLFALCAHGCYLVFFGLWHGSHPPCRGRDPISQNLITDKIVKS